MFLPALLMSACGYTNSEALALYGIVLGMSLPILYIPNSLIGSIAVVVAPEMSENFYAKRQTKLRKDVEKTLKAAIFIATMLIPLLFSLGEDIGLLLYDDKLSGQVIKNFSFMLLPMCISMITTTILNSMNYEVKTLIYFFIGALALLVCIFLLTPIMGITAYMVGLSLSNILTAILNLRLLRKNCSKVSYGKYTLKSVVVCLLSCTFGYFLRGILLLALPVFWRIFIGGVLILLFTASSFYALEMFSVRPIKKLFAR
jgi:stage V sporulation protein B